MSKKQTVLTGTFTSVWDDGSEISTECTLDTKTGEVNAKTSNADPDGCLEREYIELGDGDEKEVCTTCHSYILKTVMLPDATGKGLHEAEVCSDPDCESHENDA